MIKALVPTRIFTGTAWLHEYAIIISGAQVADIIPVRELPADIETDISPEKIIAPAFLDIQIYGAGEKLFAAFPNTEALLKLNNYCRASGTCFCLPTVATNEKEIFFQCVDAIRQYWGEGGEGILGLHLEGPWINVLKKGAHAERLIHIPTMDEVKEMLEYGRGVIKMITMAPEVATPAIVDCILSYGIVLSAGHSNATYEQAMHAFDNGFTTTTHLYNGMSGLQHRAPGLVGAAFEHELAKASIIPDGHHVDYAAIRIAKKQMGERLFVITDAVTETKIGNHQHQKVGDKYEVNGILSGSALTMHKALKNLVLYAGIEPDEALRMCSLYPARVLNLHESYGRIEKNFAASFAMMDLGMENVELLSF